MAVVNPQSKDEVVAGLHAAWRRRPVLYSLGVLFGVLFLAAVLFQDLMPGKGAFPGANSVDNIIGLLTGRSPGERTKGELRNSKSKASSPDAQKPKLPRVERVLGKVFPPETPAYPTPEQLLAFGGPLLGPGGLPSSEVPSLQGTPPAFIPGGPLITPFFGGGGGGSGGGGSGGGGGPGPVAAVPEPATWLSMILGMSLCAAALRRRKNRIGSAINAR